MKVYGSFDKEKNSESNIELIKVCEAELNDNMLVVNTDII